VPAERLSGQGGHATILIETSNTTIDLSERPLQVEAAKPWLRKGIGIHLRGCRNVVLRGARVHGYFRGILVEDCRGVTIADCDASANHEKRFYSTAEKWDRRDWIDIFHYEEWTKYGSGIALKDCRDCRVLSCRGSNQQNGLILDGCHDCVVGGCDFSHNSGWGIRLWDSSCNRIVGNNCDWCVSGESEHYSCGNDSAGILLVNGCHRNVIAGNSMQYSGDGFFLTADLDVERSDDNLICDNDGSYSPHNAFESTFCFGNRFYGNRACHSHYGFWMGFSRRNELVGNVIEGNRASGIAIEHGQRNRVTANRIVGNREGIYLFRRKASDLPSRGYLIEGNLLTGNEVALRLHETSDVTQRVDRLEGNAANVAVEEGCRRLRLECA
jgi:parallel beta-helix repeat protein